MRMKTILLGAAACVALVGPALGQDAPKKHHETLEQRLERMERTVRDQQNEIQTLRTQLPGKTSAPATAQAPAEPQVTAAQFEALQSQVYEQAAASKSTASGWWNDTKITGRMYYNITNVSQSRDHVGQAANGTSFDIKRFYLGVDHKFDDVFSANLTTDFTYDSGPASATQLYLKKAYLQAKLSDAAVFRLGAADLPWVPFAEDLYGYRYIENTLIDRTKFGTSADWGVHFSGKLYDGVINYAISAVDGAGYKKPFRSNGIDVEGRVNANIDDFTIGLGGYVGKLGKDVEGVSATHTATRFNAIAAYTNDIVRVGVEYFLANNWNNVTTAASDSADGFSLFGSYKFASQWSVFGRYDWTKPSRDVNAPLKDNYFNVGISYSPAKIVDFALVYKRDKADNGFLSTSNGTIGGLAQALGSNGTYDEIGLFGQVRW